MGAMDSLVQLVNGRRDEFRARTAVVRAELLGILDLATSQGPDTAKELGPRVERFSRSELEEVEEFAGRRLRPRAVELRHRIERGLAELQRRPDARAAEELEGCARELGVLNADFSRAVRVRNLWGSVALVGIGALLYFTTVMQRLERGLGVVASDVVWPADAYDAATEVAQGIRGELTSFRVKPEYRAGFLADFAEHYFGMNNRLPDSFEVPAGYVEKAPEAGSLTLVWKAVWENRAVDDALFVSRVEVDVTFEEARPFPWRELPIPPTEVTLRVFPPSSFAIQGERGGPAVDLDYRVKTPGGLLLVEGTIQVLSTGDLSSYYLEEGGVLVHGVMALGLDETGALAEHLFLRLDDEAVARISPQDRGEARGVASGLSHVREVDVVPAALPLEYEIREVDGVEYHVGGGLWFERIQSVARLGELTRTSLGETASVQVEYRTLAGERHELREELALDERTLYAERAPDLVEQLPRLIRSIGPRAEASKSMGGWITDELLGALDPGLHVGQSEGEKTISLRLSSDLADLAVGERVRRVTVPDRFLAPRGVLTLMHELDHPRNGTYRIDVLVGGELTETVRIEVLAPDALRWSPDHVGRFREPGQE